MKINVKLVVISLVASVVTTIFLSGCNTVQGLGKDMQQGGQQLQKAANDHA